MSNHLHPYSKPLATPTDEESEHEQLLTSFQPVVGDLIYDDLTGQVCAILQITTSKGGHPGFIVDNIHINGERYAWEISPASTAVASGSTISPVPLSKGQV